MSKPKVIAIFIRRVARGPMEQLGSVMALANQGLEGDAYATGDGSFNKVKGEGYRQVTLIDCRAFVHTDFEYAESRRNLIVDTDVMDLIGYTFYICGVEFFGEEYCSPCNTPSRYLGKKASFAEQFRGTAGIIASVITTGKIHVGGVIVPPKKSYRI